MHVSLQTHEQFFVNSLRGYIVVTVSHRSVFLQENKKFIVPVYLMVGQGASPANHFSL